MIIGGDIHNLRWAGIQMPTNTEHEEISTQVTMVTLHFKFKFSVSRSSIYQIENVGVVDAVKSS